MSFVLYDQSFYTSSRAMLAYALPILFYFVLSRWKMKENDILKVISFFSFFYLCINVVQQITHPVYYFYGREINIKYEYEMESRMGLYRFSIWGIEIVSLYMFYCFVTLFERTNGKKILGFVLSLCSLLLYLGRKNLYAGIVVFFIYVVAISKKKFYIKLCFITILILSFFLLLPFMQDLNEQTIDELGNESDNYIRFIAADYFINHFDNSPLYYLFGSGISDGESKLAMLINNLKESGIYQDDCGFVGFFSKFGLLGLTIQILIIIKIIINYKYIDNYLLLYCVNAILISFFNFWGNSSRALISWSIFLYLVSQSIEKNKSVMLKQ